MLPGFGDCIHILNGTTTNEAQIRWKVTVQGLASFSRSHQESPEIPEHTPQKDHFPDKFGE
jgi:hypothetical protein